MFHFNQNKKAGYKTLPDDIIFAILSKLPIESLQRFRCVCKHWRNLTYDPHFIDEHHKLQPPCIVLLSKPECMDRVGRSTEMTKQKLYIMDQCFKVQEIPNEHVGGKLELCIVGSCNGLICLATNEDGVDHPIIICNPFTRESIVLPEAKPDHAHNISDYDCLSVGFGFHPPTREYKVVRVYRYYHEIIAEIITLGAKEWRKLDMPCCTETVGRVKTVVVDGKMHWFIENPVDDKLVMSFDIGNETFEAVSTPPQVKHMFFDIENLTLENIGGLLTIVERIPKNLPTMWFLMDRGRKIWSNQMVCDANAMINQIHSYPSVADYLFFDKCSGARMVQLLIENTFIALYMRTEATKMVFQVIKRADCSSEWGVKVDWIANEYMPMLTSLKDM